MSETSVTTINSVSHAIKVLELLAERGSLGLSTLSEEVSLPRATALRVLNTLSQHGLVTRDGKKYRLTLRLLDIALNIQSAGHLQAVTEPLLRELVSRTGETAHFAVLDGDCAGYIAKVDSPHPLRMFSRVGWRGPLHATGLGKAMLPYVDPTVRKQLSLTRYTAHTITTHAALEREVQRIAAQGYAVDDEELIDGLRCFAVPITSGVRLLGALSVAGPASRVTLERTPELIRALQESAEELKGRIS